MFHPLLDNSAKIIQYVFLWLAYALLQAFVFYSIVALPIWILFLDGLVHAVLFGIIGLILWSVLKYGNFQVLTLYQRLVNHVALAFLSIVLWLGIGYGLFYLIFGKELTALFIPFLPIRGFIGLLVYLLIIQYFRFQLYQSETQIEVIETELFEEVSKQKVSNTKDLLERIAVKSGSKIHVVLISEILYFQADGDYVQIFTAQGKYLKEQTMKYFEEHLPEFQFARVHRSIIVNVEMISRIELYEKQNQLLTLKNGQQIKTSPSGYKALRAILNL
jgi:hypothetical protein